MLISILHALVMESIGLGIKCNAGQANVVDYKEECYLLLLLDNLSYSWMNVGQSGEGIECPCRLTNAGSMLAPAYLQQSDSGSRSCCHLISSLLSYLLPR